MADPFSDQDHGQGGASKRPAQTIEGTATEISEEATGGDAAPKAEAAAGADRPDVAGDAANGIDAALPPAQASLPELKSFVTHLAAGVLGGLVGVIGLALAWGGLGGARSSGASAGYRRAGSAHRQARNRAARLRRWRSIGATQGPGRSLGDRRQGNLAQACRSCRPRRPTRNLAQGHLPIGERRRLRRLGCGHCPADRRGRAAARRQDRRCAAKGAANASSLQEMQSEIAELKAKIGALAELGTGDGAAAGPALAALTERLAKLEAAMPELAAAIGKENNGAKSAAAPSPSPIFAPRSAMDGLMPQSSTRLARWCPPSAISAFCPLMPKRASRPRPILPAHSLSPRRARRWRRRRPPAVRLSIR